MVKPKRLDVTRWAVVWPDGTVEITWNRAAALDLSDWYYIKAPEPRICKVRITEIVPKKKVRKK